MIVWMASSNRGCAYCSGTPRLHERSCGPTCAASMSGTERISSSAASAGALSILRSKTLSAQRSATYWLTAVSSSRSPFNTSSNTRPLSGRSLTAPRNRRAVWPPRRAQLALSVQPLSQPPPFERPQLARAPHPPRLFGGFDVRREDAARAVVERDGGLIRIGRGDARQWGEAERAIGLAH